MRRYRTSSRVENGGVMFSAAGLISFALGISLVYRAKNFPSNLDALETAGGVFIITGLALLGAGLQVLATGITQ